MTKNNFLNQSEKNEDNESKTNICPERYREIITNDEIFDMKNVENNLEEILEESNDILKEKHLSIFTYKVLLQLKDLFDLSQNKELSITGGLVLNKTESLIISGIGKYKKYCGKYDRELLSEKVYTRISEIKESIFWSKEYFYIYYKISTGLIYSIYLEGKGFDSVKNQMEKYIKIFFRNIVLAFDNLSLNKELEKKLREINMLAKHDSLTKLPNRVFFIEEAERIIKEKDKNNKIVLIWIGIDNFKEINEKFGEKMGDRVLKYFSKKLYKITVKGGLQKEKIISFPIIEKDNYCIIFNEDDEIRTEESKENNFVLISRTGGDEFAILISTEKDRCDKFLDYFSSIEINYLHKESNIELGFSAGISNFEKEKTIETMIIETKTALTEAKKSGGDKIYEYSDDLKKELEQELGIEEELKDALIRKEFELYYQPKIDLKKNKIVGAEALIRWNNPEKGLISPNKFIPIAEKSGFISKIGDYVIEEAFFKLAEWQKINSEFVLSINLSPIQLMDKRFFIRIERFISLSSVNPEKIEFEITENTLMENLKSSMKLLENLKEMGIKLSIDDFGTGYSSLNYLKKLSIDTLKIDKSFLDDLGKDLETHHIINAIITIGKILDLKIVAEGVEKIEQVEILKELNCDEAQGYYYSKPLPVKEFEENYIKNSK